MQLKITHRTSYTYSDVVPVCQNMVHLAPRQTERQLCSSYRLLVVPEPVERSFHNDYFGNRVDYFSIQEAHRGLSVSSTSVLEVNDREEIPNAEASPAWEDCLPSTSVEPMVEALGTHLYRFASQYTPLSEEYADYARESFLPGRPILASGLDLTSRIYNDFKYDPRATTVSTPVHEVFSRRAGVCQDFAHLQNACLRSLGLAARYVSGYLRTLPPPGKPRLVGADASHAWISLYCGRLGWVDFDPTNNMIPKADHVTVALGRDYRDCCPVRGVYVGGGEQTLNVTVDVMPLDTDASSDQSR